MKLYNGHKEGKWTGGNYSLNGTGIPVLLQWVLHGFISWRWEKFTRKAINKELDLRGKKRKGHRCLFAAVFALIFFTLKSTERFSRNKSILMPCFVLSSACKQTVVVYMEE